MVSQKTVVLGCPWCPQIFRSLGRPWGTHHGPKNSRFGSRAGVSLGRPWGPSQVVVKYSMGPPHLFPNPSQTWPKITLPTLPSPKPSQRVRKGSQNLPFGCLLGRPWDTIFFASGWNTSDVIFFLLLLHHLEATEHLNMYELQNTSSPSLAGDTYSKVKKHLRQFLHMLHWSKVSMGAIGKLQHSNLFFTAARHLTIGEFPGAGRGCPNQLPYLRGPNLSYPARIDAV
eukprot:jgi/Botrbrau1/7202/Bobra.0300s0028.1